VFRPLDRGLPAFAEERARFFSKILELQRLLNVGDKVTDSLTNSAGFWYQVVNSIDHRPSAIGA